MGIVQGDDNLDARPSIVQTPQPLSEESKGYLRDGNLLVASNVVAVQTGQIKDQHSSIFRSGVKQSNALPNARRTNVLWAALAATLSFAAVAFFVRQCSIGLQATQASVTPRQLAEAPGISPELTTCQGEVTSPGEEIAKQIVGRVKRWLISSHDVSFAFKVENFVVRAEVDAQSREAGPELEAINVALVEATGGMRPHLAREIPSLPPGRQMSITRVIRTPRSVEHWIQLIIRHAEGKEREANPKVVYEWAQDVLKFTEEKKAKLLVGSLLYKLKYKVIGYYTNVSLRQEAAHEVQSNWDRAETMILDSARTGRKEVFSVAAEKRNAKTFHMAIVQIKMREASWKEQRRLRGHPTKDATGRTSWIQRGGTLEEGRGGTGGPYDVSDWVEFSLKGPPTPPPLPTPSLPMPPFPAPSLPTSYIPPPPPSQPLRPAQPTNPGDLPYLDELKSRLSSGSLGLRPVRTAAGGAQASGRTSSQQLRRMAGGAQGQTGGAQGQTGGAQGQTGGDQGQTGGAQGQTGGAQGQTGGAQGQTGGAQGQTGGAQDQTRRLSLTVRWMPPGTGGAHGRTSPPAPAVHPGPSGDESGASGQTPPPTPAVQLEPSGEGAAESGSQGQSPP